MNLVMFDIDGTLKKYDSIFDDLYTETVKEYLNITEIDTDWNRYHNATDSSITAEIIEEKSGRLATNKDLDIIRNNLFQKVQKIALKEPHHFCEIMGARSMLTELASSPNAAIAIATGNWKEIALLKLRMTSLVLPDVIVASASDAFSRQEIMRIAERKTVKKFKNTSLDSVVYVGDAAWDVRAALELEYQFIGIGIGERADKLKNAGATCIIPDYSDKQKFFTILEKMWGTQ